MDEKFMREAVRLAEESVARGGGPFGAVVVRDGEIIAAASNRVTLDNDPTAHAEVAAIREACRREGSFKLAGCEIYASCEPCPMCLSAIYWAGISRIYYGGTRGDAKAAGFDDSFIYDEIPLAPERRAVPAGQLLVEGVQGPFRLWAEKEDKTEY